tara:strand:- start:527 stop:1132 length:606 start_codon:yes stop_codon:yes gene_type:complete
MNPIDAAKIAERCQRNWDYSKPIPQDDIDTIVNTAKTMPTKQNRMYYRIIVSTNQKYNKKLYKLSINEDDPSFEKKYHRNSQVLAPLTLSFIPPQKWPVHEFDDDISKNFYTSIGIASGVAAHTAATLGYRTGYCACIHEETYEKLLTTKLNLEFEHFGSGLILGIGHPNSLYKRWDVVVDNALRIKLDDSCDKEIEIITI